MRFSVGLIAIITSLMLAGCATPEQREVAALEKELGLFGGIGFGNTLL